MPKITQSVVDEFKRIAEWDDQKKAWVYKEDRWTGGCSSHITKNKGDIIESVGTDGYHRIAINGDRFRLHRIVYCLYNGVLEDDTLTVDHIDCDKTNNHPCNLRKATMRENNFNHSKNNEICSSSQYKGVRKEGEKYRARLTKDGHEYSSDLFTFEINAAIEYNKMAIEHFNKFANLNAIPDMELPAEPDEVLQSSNYNGVYWNKKAEKYWAMIRVPGTKEKDGKSNKKKYLGSFSREKEAAMAYDRAVILYGLDLKKLNFRTPAIV